MSPDEIIAYCLSKFDDVVLINSWGEKGIFYNPEGTFKRGIYVLTVKEKDGNNDRASMLNREGVYRVNIGFKKETFFNMFGIAPKRPAAGCVVNMNIDFTKLDTIMPHPVYAWMCWACVLSPSTETFDFFEHLIQESYELAKLKFLKRTASKLQ